MFTFKKKVVFCNRINQLFKKIKNKGVIVYSAKDAQALSGLLQEVLRNKDCIYSDSKQNSELCEKYYSIDINYQSIMTICNR